MKKGVIMQDKEIYEYLKKTSLIDVIELVARQNNLEIVKDKDVDVYYTAKDLFELYPNIFSKYKLDKYIKEDNLPVIKDGKDRLFLKSNVETWLKYKRENQYGNRC